MFGAAMRWLPLLLCCAAVCALPLPEEVDSDETRRVLGSSVVTSVSVLMENENGTKTAYFADAAGQPMKRPHEGDDIGSPVDLISPDKYQFYTFDRSGNLITRYMTRDEVRSIIANGQKNNDVKQESPPTFYHNLPASPDELTFEPTVEETPDHFAQAQMKMHSVVASVQSVLKSQMEDKVKTEVHSPITPDTPVAWSMILPELLGNTATENTTIDESVSKDTIETTTIPHESADASESSESLPMGDAPQVSSESGSGDSDKEAIESSSAEEQDTSSTFAPVPVSTIHESTEHHSSLTVPSTTEFAHTSGDLEADKSTVISETSEVSEKQTATHTVSSESTTITESPEEVQSTEITNQYNTDASIAETAEISSLESTASNIKNTESTDSADSIDDSAHMADAPVHSELDDVSVFAVDDGKITHMEVAADHLPESMSHTKPVKEVVEGQRPPVKPESVEDAKRPIDMLASLSVLSDENSSSFNKVVHSNEKPDVNLDYEAAINDTKENMSVEQMEEVELIKHEAAQKNTQVDSQSTDDVSLSHEVTHTINPTQKTTESKEDSSSEESDTSKPTSTNASNQSESTSMNDLNVTEQLATALSDLFSTVSKEALQSFDNEETEDNTTKITQTPKSEENDEILTKVVVTSVSSSQSSQSSSTSVSSAPALNDGSGDSDLIVSVLEAVKPNENNDHDVVVSSESVQKIVQILEPPALTTSENVNQKVSNETPVVINHVNAFEIIPMTEDNHNHAIHINNNNALEESSEGNKNPHSEENKNHLHPDETIKTKTSVNEESVGNIPNIVPYNNDLFTSERLEMTTVHEGVTHVAFTYADAATEGETIPVSSEAETEKQTSMEVTTQRSEGSGDDESTEHPTESEESSEGSGWSPTEMTPLRDAAGSGSGDGVDDTEYSAERTTKGYSIKDTYKMTDDALPGLTSSEEELWDVNRYVTGPKDIGVTTPQTTEEENEDDKNADDLYDVNNYANSSIDIGITTPVSIDEMTTLKQQLELNDEPVNFDDHMVKHSSSNEEISAENIYNIPNSNEAGKDVEVTTPVSDEDQKDVTKADNDIYDVNNYVNSDKDLGVTTISNLDESQTDKALDQEQNDEDLSAGNVYDKDLGVTTQPDDASQDNSDDMYDVNNYVNSDKDLGMTTPSSVEESQTETYTTQETTNDSKGPMQKLVEKTTDSGEIDGEWATTTLLPSEEQTQDDKVATKPAESLSSEDVNTRVSSGVVMKPSNSSESSDNTETTTSAIVDLLMNDQPIVSSSSEDSAESTESDPSQQNVQYYKPPLEVNSKLNSEKHKLGASGDFQWTKVDTIKTPMKDSQNSPSAAVELHPAPQESLGLEASTVHLYEDVQKFADLCNELAFKMWTSLTEKGVSTSRSLVMSPFATTSQLSMLFLGARGPTSGQMNDMLKLDDMMTFNPHQVFRNVTDSVLQENPGVSTAAFVREIFSDSGRGKMLDFYKQRVSHFYDGHVEEVDFASIGDTLRRRTNLFVKRQTGGKVSEYMRGSSLELQPPLAAFSANIFQTDCSTASTEGRDGEMYFTILPATRQRRLVPIPAVVYRSGFMAGYEPGLDATVVSLGNHDAAISTLLVLPGQQGQLAPGDGLPRLEERLINSSYSDGAWSKLLRSLLSRTGLEVQIPRFSHRSQLNITHSLQTMGLNDLFDPTHADLKGLSGSANDLHVSDVIQVNTFSTCGEDMIGARHHVEVYPSGPNRSGRQEDESQEEDLDSVPLVLRPRQARLDVNPGPSGFEDLVQDSIYQMPLALRPRQARLPEGEDSLPRLKYDRPFLYFVRHNPTGFILHMGRFNPRLLH